MGVRLRATFRASALLFTALQVAVGMAVPIADARLDLAGLDLPTHVESAGDASCGAAHDHAFCQLCRTLGLGTVAPCGERKPCLPVGTTGPSKAIAGTLPRASLDAMGPVGPRAPPRA